MYLKVYHVEVCRVSCEEFKFSEFGHGSFSLPSQLGEELHKYSLQINHGTFREVEETIRASKDNIYWETLNLCHNEATWRLLTDHSVAPNKFSDLGNFPCNPYLFFDK